MKLLLFVSLLGCLLFSCQSEYDRQMAHAKQHKYQLQIQRNSLDVQSIEKLEAKIYFCAELTGAKSTFLQELERIP